MIRLSTNFRYATRILVYLASRDDDRPARRQEISEAESISAGYVEQILRSLKAAGLTKSRRGIKGGYLLAKDPGRISVSDVFEATEGPLSLVPCLTEGCERLPDCVTRPVWEQASEALKQVFSGMTIADMAEKSKSRRKSSPLAFEI